jgi:hypothetical protein
LDHLHVKLTDAERRAYDGDFAVHEARPGVYQVALTFDANFTGAVEIVASAIDQGGFEIARSLPLSARVTPGMLNHQTVSMQALLGGLADYWKFEHNLDDAIGGRSLVPVDSAPDWPLYWKDELRFGSSLDQAEWTESVSAKLGVTRSQGDIPLNGDFTLSGWFFLDRLQSAFVADGCGIWSHEGLLTDQQFAVGAYCTQTAGMASCNPATAARCTNAILRLTLSDLANSHAFEATDDSGFVFAPVENHFPPGPGVQVAFHLLVIRQGDVFRMRINNLGTASVEIKREQLRGVADFTLGQDFGYAWLGSFDEVGVWNRALADRECAMLYNGGSGWPPPF